MTDFVVRPAVEGEQRGLFEVLGRSLHAPPVDDERWEKRSAGWPADRKVGAFADKQPIGVASSVGTAMTVPGGNVVPAAAVDGVGVRADHTRRGVLTAMMREQLGDLQARGEVLAALHASETTIYGRFGYGIGTRSQEVRISPRQARLRDGAPAGGQVRLISSSEAIELLPELYRRIGLGRPGMIERPQRWWSSQTHRMKDLVVAVHTGPDGDDGFVAYQPQDRVMKPPEMRIALAVHNLHGANTAAVAGLWRFLLKIDLVGEILAFGRPLDEPLVPMLVDTRAWRVTDVSDELWVRLVDVPAALAARSYRDGDPVVIEVRDPFLPANSGCYRIGPDGAGRTDELPQLRLDVDVLAMLYLGEWQATTLAAAGRIEALQADAPERADELLRTPTRPWCGTGF
ncbi:GNAT family N-acetyltransferase [Amycolatopsis taiwanensis]|uniref:GNAT family N-acetyltransferase n=1 Tax=Amycolatopsis taiwanensis TaxID=342230 RepID=UPI000487EF92|nr:GNAT family N-acetyltransferase [Amycolatopsis taiwanensis]